MKREFLALQALGEQLIGLTAEQLQSIGLEERLLDAVIAAKSMRAHGALRRQKQLIGKLMRGVDPEPIRAALDAFGQNARMEKTIFRQAEKWRDRITSGDDDDLAAFSEFLGYKNVALMNEVGSFRSACDEKSRRHARRRIFREIHKELAHKMQS